MAVVLTQSFTRAPFSQTSKHPRQPPKPLPAVRLSTRPCGPGLAAPLSSPSQLSQLSHFGTPAPGRRSVRAQVAMPRRGAEGLPPPPEQTEVQVGRVLLPRNPAPQDPSRVPSAESARILVTPSMERSTHYLAKNWAAGVPTKLEGATGVGKTAVIRHLAHLTNSEYMRVNLSYFTEVEDLLGRHVGGTHEHTEAKLQARSDEQLRRVAASLELSPEGGRPAVIARILREQGKIRWVDGPVVKAMQRGAVLLLDEINLARPEVIEALNGLFDRGQLINQNGVQSVSAHPGFQLFATQNPSTYAGRQDMSAALSSRWATLTWEPLPADEVFAVLQSRYGKALPESLFAKLCMAHTQLATMAEAGQLGADRGGVAYTLRDLFKVADRFLRYRAKNPAKISDAYLLARETYEVYVGGLEDPGDRQRIRATLTPFLPAIGEDFYKGLSLQRTQAGWRIGDVELSDHATGHVFVPTTDLVMTPTTLEVYARLFKALDMRENVALIGERASGKSAMGEAYAAHAGLPFYPEHFDAGMDGSRLIGTDTPQGWQDGLLLTAARQGGILLADEFNLAPPEILERLNSLLDDERMLVLSEKEGERVELHPDFRFIATMNPPKYAGRHKLSRAMLNRLTCIAVPTLEARSDLTPIVEHKLAQAKPPQPAAVNAAIAGAIVGLHTWISNAYRVGTLGKTLRRKDIPDFSLRQVLYVTRLVTRFSSQEGAAEALRDALNMGYAQNGSAEDKAMVHQEIELAVEQVQRTLGPGQAAPPREPKPAAAEAEEDGPRTVFLENGVYHGDTQDGLAHGQGNEQFLDGTIYEGQFQKGLRHGRGVLRAVDRIYTGDFVEGHLQGQGILRYANGDRYEGGFEDDAFHGQGTFFYADGQRVDGTFSRGVLVEGKGYGEEPQAKPEANAAPPRGQKAPPKPEGVEVIPPAVAPVGPQRIDKQAMTTALRKWTDSAPMRLRENYKVAAEKILSAYEHRTTLLDLQFFDLESLPDALVNLQGHLTHLRLGGSSFKTLPQVVTELTCLRTLEAPRCRIEFLPESIGQLVNLTSIHLQGNRLQALPESLGSCRKLVNLMLQGNQLQTLPIRIGALQRLRRLMLANNALRGLPFTAKHWQDLVELDLSHNRLDAVPDSVVGWTRLEQLDLSDNGLSGLPEELKKLQRLGALHLENNPLKGPLPDWLADMPSLRAVWTGQGTARLSEKLRRSRLKIG